MPTSGKFLMHRLSPGAMAMGSTGDVALAEEVSVATARELRLAGINWVYSPVADVNSDQRNPVIGELNSAFSFY